METLAPTMSANKEALAVLKEYFGFDSLLLDLTYSY
jgi:hypothetical protein